MKERGDSTALALARDLLIIPREAGSESAKQARDLVAGFLENLGYTVEVQRFSFSTAGLLALPLFGAGLGWLTLLEIPLLTMAGTPPWSASLVWVLGMLAVATLSVGLGLGWTSLGGQMREDANLVATRGPVIRRWIVAHLDTKAQRHSMAGRLVSVWISALATIVMTVLVLVRLGNVLPLSATAGAAALAIVAGFLANRGRLSGVSHGARDNGTGLLAALTAAQNISDPAVGILVTGAEEFGLIGARYFAQQSRDRVAGSEVINFDTIDDQGDWRVVVHDDRAMSLADSAASHLESTTVPVRRHRLPAGIFVDSLPLARAGAVAVTIARLDWGTLRKIHTPGDTLAGLTLESAVRAGRAICDL
ncbi:MAG: M28 family peptidase [Gemmatimonadota bacterium]